MALMFSVSDFCHDHGISRGTFYKLVKAGRGPAIAKIGRRTLISAEAAAAWRRRMEQEAAEPQPSPTSVAERTKPGSIVPESKVDEIVREAIRDIRAEREAREARRRIELTADRSAA
jgi:predicted DNA-binding transcriptional regulator AlpA